jgi:flagellum-specific peptidoglycan hydrolase FlgJ
MALSFAFDTSKGETPQTIAQRRQMSNLIAARMLGTAPKNVGEGLNALGQAIIARSMMGDADTAQKAGEASLPDFIKAQITGQSATPSVVTPPAVAAAPMGATSIPAGGAEFTNSVMPLAQAVSEKTGIDPRLIVAQAALETGYGKSAPGNNLFGIKSHGQPGGNVLPTTEVVNGQPVRTTDSFAAYASPADSANGYADFINKNPRYAPLKAAQGLEAQAAALGQSGYATDPNYGQKVLKIAQSLPAPTGGVLADNSPSPLDNAQYPAGPVGAPTAVAGATPAPVDDGSGATLPANAHPTGGVLPTAQAVQAAAQPQNRFLFKNASDEDLQKALINPFTPENVRTALTQEYKMRADAAQKAADPMRALDMQTKQLAIRKAQQDLDKPSDKMQVVKIGQDSLGREQYGIFNKTDGTIKPYTPPNGGQPDPLGNTDLTGKEYLATLPKEQANTVQLMVEGKIPPPTSFAMSKPYWQNMISAAKNYDPTFDATAWAGRVAGTRDFSAGKSAEMVRSANQTLHHVGSLLDSMDKLNNGTYPMLNSVGNFIAEARGSGAQGAFRTNAHAVAEELSKVFKGNNLSDAEIKSWEHNLHENMSPEQQRTQVAKLSELLQGSLHALDEKRTASLGPIAAQKAGPIIKEEGQRVLERINKWVNGDKTAAAPATSAAPQGKTSSGVSWSIQ